SGTVALPAPLHIACVDVVRGERPGVVTTDMEDHESAIDHRRERMRGVKRDRRRARLLPHLLTAVGVVRRDDASHADREQSPIGEGWRGLRSWTVSGRRTVHRERRIVTGLPDHFAGVHVERRHYLAFTLSRELIDAIADDERCCVAGADL